MQFGPVAVADACGAILAHGVRAAGTVMKKGRVLSDADVAALAQAGIADVVAARLEPGDVHEDTAAERLGLALQGAGITARAPFTGRMNLHADCEGLLELDPAALHALNSVDEAITASTLAPYTWVRARQMVATIKIIPFSVPERALALALARCAPARLAVRAFASRRVALVQTRLADTRANVLDKTVRVTAARLKALGSSLDAERRVDHGRDAVAAAVRELAPAHDIVLVAGASAIVDRRDVIPAAIEAAGGRVVHFGMPVDPGNLILVGALAGKPVLGLPGCARSPAFNGVDLVLQRLVAGFDVDAAAVMAMGAGGLLKEYAGRPTPRAGERAAAVPSAPRIGAVVLAAGQSRRMGSTNKLLVDVDGRPMVVTAVANALAAGLAPVVVVTGHEHARVARALDGLDVQFVHNPQYADGLSTSLARGIRALPEDIDAVVVCLADMPRLTAPVLERLAAAFDPVEGRSICVPTWQGKRGNPVLWDRRFFAEMTEVTGDTGARHLLGEHADLVCEVAMNDAGVLNDIDSPAELAALTGDSPGPRARAHPDPAPRG